jgi:hypothetical protein
MMITCWMGVRGEAAEAGAIVRTGNAVVARQRALKSPLAVMEISICARRSRGRGCFVDERADAE